VSRYLDIEKALIQAYTVLPDNPPTSYPASNLNDADRPNALWVQLTNVRGDSGPVTLGAAGEDNHNGFLQIDINAPRDSGTAVALEKADFYASSFTSGTRLVYNGQEVIVLSTSLSSGRIVGGYYRLSLTINYYARTTRS